MSGEAADSRVRGATHPGGARGAAQHRPARLEAPPRTRIRDISAVLRPSAWAQELQADRPPQMAASLLVTAWHAHSHAYRGTGPFKGKGPNLIPYFCVGDIHKYAMYFDQDKEKLQQQR